MDFNARQLIQNDINHTFITPYQNYSSSRSVKFHILPPCKLHPLDIPSDAKGSRNGKCTSAIYRNEYSPNMNHALARIQVPFVTPFGKILL